MILIDTNVLSEALKPSPAPQVVQWLDENFSEAAVASITIFELSAGVSMMTAGRRRDSLQAALARLTRRFGARVYAFDLVAARAAAELLERAHLSGLQIPSKLADLQIGGIALAYDLALATRNRRDFEGLGLELVDPWTPL